MAIKTFKYFDAGVGFKDQAADNITTNGVIYRNGNSLKLYIESALRTIVTDSQTQTLTNKTISGASNTITNVPVTALTAIIDTDLTSVSALDDTIPSAKATKAYVDAQLLTKDAANEIAFTPTGVIVATDVQAAVASVSINIETHKANATGAHAASAIANTPAGNIASTTVQAALNELDTEKVATTVTVNGQALSANVVLAKADVGLGNVDNTSDATKNSAAVTLTNKTIVATANTISAIADTNISATAAIARTKIASGTNNALQANSATGVLSDISDITVGTNSFTLANTKHLEIQAATDATTTGSNASLTAFTGGAIRLTNASLVSLANIPAGANGQEIVIFNRTGAAVSVVDSSAATGTAANRIFTGTSANISFAKDAALILSYDSTSARWQVIGGTGGGSSELPLDVLAQQTFESATLTDFTQTGLALVTASNLLIKNAKAAQLISNASVTQSFKQVIAVDNEFRGKNLTVNLYTRSSATQGNVTVLFYDETNAANLVASQPITLGSTTISATTAVGTTISALSVADVNKLKIGQTITGSGIVTGTTIASINTTALTATLSQAATAAATVTLRISDLPARQAFSFNVPTNCASLSYTISALAEANAPESYFDDIVFKLTATALSSTSISQTVYNATDWTPYTPTFTGFGTPTAVEFEYRQNGQNYDIRGKFASGTSTAVEARISLPLSATSSGTGVIPSLSVAGLMVTNLSTATQNNFCILMEPSVGYVTFGAQQTSQVMLSKQVANGFISSGTLVSFTASVPIAGLTTSTTTSTTIPLTTAQLVQTPDSYMRFTHTTILLATTNTRILTFTTSTLQENIGSAIQYLDDAANGARFVAQQAGLYKFNFNGDLTSTAAYLGFSKNSTSLSTNIDAIPASERLNLSYDGGATSISTVSTEAYLNVGDIVRVHAGAAVNTTGAVTLTASFAGSLKQLNASSDAKITIPTHSLRFSGASSLGTGANAAVVQFTSQVLTQGDGFSVSNANGTLVTIKKAGKLNISAGFSAAINSSTIIVKNATTLSSFTRDSSVIAEFDISPAQPISLSGFTDVVPGDVIAVVCTAAPSALATNQFTLSLTENSIAANFSNVLPQWSQSDSSVQLRTAAAGAAGYGTTNTKIRRFSNTVQNLGSDISYIDDAALGGSFTILTDGTYTISYVDLTSATSNHGISKNSSQLATTIDTITASDVLAVMTKSANFAAEVSWQGFLSKNDVIRAHGDATATGSNGTAEAKFTISKVGKPNLTSVDVTPFVNMKTTDVEAARALDQATLVSGTGVNLRFPSPVSFTNKGVISITDDGTNTRFTALKACSININVLALLGQTTGNLLNICLNGNSTTTNRIALSGTNSTIQDYNQVAFTGLLNAGDYLTVVAASALRTAVGSYNFTATADNNATASPTQQVSSDTMAFAFKATAIAATDPIGTFNTYTYLANSPTPVISASAPSQTVASMNINGIQLFSRAPASATTTGSPARVDIFIGTGLKSRQVDGYAALAKTTAINYDHVLFSTTGEQGISALVYNELTGILAIDFGCYYSGSYTNRNVGVDIAGTAYTSGYFVFNASKSPVLTTIPSQQQVSFSANTSTTAATTSQCFIYTTIDHNVLGGYSTSTGKFTAPIAGKYQFNFSAFSSSSFHISLYRNGATLYQGGYSATGAGVAVGAHVVSLIAGDVVEVRPLESITASGGAFNNNFSGFLIK